MRRYHKPRKGVYPGAHPFVRAMYEEMIRQRISYDHVAEKSGVSDAAILHWKNEGKCPKLHDIEAVLNVLGLEIKLVPMRRD